MKKRSCFLVLYLLICSLSTNGQLEYQLHLGGNTSSYFSDPRNIVFNEGFNNDYQLDHFFFGVPNWKYGYQIGASIKFGLREKISLIGNLQLNQSKYKVEFEIKKLNSPPDDNEAIFLSNINLKNLDLITEIVWNPVERLHLGVGIYSGLKTNQMVEKNYFVPGSNFSEGLTRVDDLLGGDVNIDLSRFEFGVSSSLAYTIWKFDLTLRGMYSFNESLHYSYSDVNDEVVFENNRQSLTFQLSLGYTFNSKQ